MPGKNVNLFLNTSIKYILASLGIFTEILIPVLHKFKPNLNNVNTVFIVFLYMSIKF